MKRIDHKYLNWLVHIVECPEYNSLNYKNLLETLMDIPFRWVLEMDANRVEDAFELREDYYVFYDDPNESVFCLEVIIALAVRIEDDIMYDPDLGDHTGSWFWLMLEKLGLTAYDDDHFDEQKVREIIDIWLDRTGKIGLFGPKYYSKNVEIWDQMMAYFEKKV